MSLPAAVVSVLRQYATFSGRARRSELWWFVLAHNVVLFVASLAIAPAASAELTDALSGLADDDVEGLTAAVSAYLGSFTVLYLIGLALLLPTLAVYVRRLHDIDKSGVSVLIGLVPLVGPILLIVWLATAGTVGANRFGADPKAVAAAPTPVTV